MNCWASSIPNKVLNLINKELTKMLDLKEIKAAIAAMPKGKAIGRDGLPMEFFKENSKDVAPHLLQAYIAMLELGNTSEFINKGLIFLIPTFGDHSRLGNWHPVTLLRNIYKILSKVLSQTLQPFLPGIIRPNQTGFVKGRACGCKSWASHPHAKFVQRVW